MKHTGKGGISVCTLHFSMPPKNVRLIPASAARMLLLCLPSKGCAGGVQVCHRNILIRGFVLTHTALISPQYRCPRSLALLRFTQLERVKPRTRHERRPGWGGRRGMFYMLVIKCVSFCRSVLAQKSWSIFRDGDKNRCSVKTFTLISSQGETTCEKVNSSE